MKVVVDKYIPFIQGVLEPYAEVIYADPAHITAHLVRDAQALIVRTRTRCDAHLLSGSSVQFIATATIGYDHIDAAYCADNGIAWTSAAGCNAQAVRQYVEAALDYHEQVRGVNLKGKTLGVVGVGNIGRLIVDMAERRGMRVLQNDPPRQRKEQNAAFVSLKEVALGADVVTFHTPLIHEGVDRTYHLCDERFVQQLKPDAILINAARGGIVCEKALKTRPDVMRNAVIDCWEHEPMIDPSLCSEVAVATAHIAGYSQQGKVNGSAMSVQALAQHFGIEDLEHWEVEGVSCSKLEAAQYDIMTDCEILRKHINQFEQIRSNYSLR